MGFQRIMFHADLNSCYASIAQMEYPSLRGKAIAVCGSEELRHGIVLAASIEAKKFGIKTGNANWEARQKCRHLEVVSIHDLGRKTIRRVSDAFFDILSDYTDRLQFEGDDGAYMDLTGCLRNFDEAAKAANEIRERVKKEIGVTASVGVSFNRNFAKIGSDYKKPDAVTVISPENWREIVWPLPVSDLYWVGPATTRKLSSIGVLTIGQLANSECRSIHNRYGVVGRMLWNYANGIDDNPVALKGERPIEKTIGNSHTFSRDLETAEDIRQGVIMLSESVSERLREGHYYCNGVKIYLRYFDLSGIDRQMHLPFPSRTSWLISDTATNLAQKHWSGEPLRSMEVRAFGLIADDYLQMTLLPTMKQDVRKEALDTAMQDIRRRMGRGIIKRCGEMVDRKLTGIDIRGAEAAQSNAFRRF